MVRFDVRILAKVVLIFAVLIAGASAQTTAQSPGRKLPTIPFEKYKLKNGLEVILSDDRTLPLVSVNLWYHVGPANERPGRTGFAHLFEHMMFEGSQHVGGKAHFAYLEGAGAISSNGGAVEGERRALSAGVAGLAVAFGLGAGVDASNQVMIPLVAFARDLSVLPKVRS